DKHFDAIEAEYCLAEGGGVGRTAGKYTRASISTTEKEPRAVEIVAHGPAGHGSVPRQSNVVAHLSNSVAKIVAWTPQLRVNETTGSYFRKLAASAASPEAAKRYRDVLNPDAKVSKPAADWMLDNEPEHWSMLHTSVVPTILTAGYRYNVIPSEAKATLDVRLHPDEDQSKFLDQIRAVIYDPAVEVRWARERYRPPVAPEHRAVRRDRDRDEEALQRRRAADDEHGGERQSADSVQGRTVLWHRAGAGHGGWRERFRRPQRSGTDPRGRAAPVRAVPVRRGDGRGAGEVIRRAHG